MIAFKILFIVLDSLLILAGVALAISSFYGAYESDRFHLENKQSWSVVLLKVIGAFGVLIALTGIAGLIAAIVDSDVLKSVYIGVLTAISTFLLIMGIVGIVTGVFAKKALDNHLRTQMTNYDPDKDESKQIDALQLGAECCGLSGEKVYNSSRLPWSCCKTVDKLKNDLLKVDPTSADSLKRAQHDVKAPCLEKDAFKRQCDGLYSSPCVALKSTGIALVVIGLVLIALATCLCLS